MLDIFKGMVGTAAVLALTIWWGARNRSSDVLVHALPVVAFLLPMLMRNHRWLIGCTGLFAAGIVFVVWDVGDSRDAPFVYLALLWIAAGVVLGVTTRYLLQGLLSYLKRKRWAGVGATHPSEPAKPLPPITVRSLIFSACAVVATFVAYSLFVMQSAKASAEQIAAGRPYCVQVAKSNGGYRSVRSRLELAGFYMMSQLAKHSVLVVSDAGKLEFYHWSYRHNGFVAEPYASPPTWCEPALDFLKHTRAVESLGEERPTLASRVLIAPSFAQADETEEHDDCHGLSRRSHRRRCQLHPRQHHRGDRWRGSGVPRLAETHNAASPVRRMRSALADPSIT